MILSKNNEKIKKVRSLKQKKYRDESGVFLVEGERAVKDALAFSRVLAVFGTEDALRKCGLAETGEVPESNADEKTAVYAVSPEVYETLSDTVSPQGITAVAQKRQGISAEKSENAGNAENAGKAERSLLLDGVSDPGNVGAILRTAAAAGYQNVFLADCADPYSPKAVRAAMGGIFRVNLAEGNREEILSLIRVPIVVASMEGENAFNANLPAAFCLAVGNEANGVSDFVRKKAAFTVSIPMQSGVESLNAAVSAGILMYLFAEKP